MKILLTFCFALLTCAALHAQTLVIRGSNWTWRGTSMSDIKGEWNPPLASSNYCDGRFTIWDANTNVVLDNDSGLTWTRDADIDGKKLWTNAVAYCSNLVYAGYSDWRLPSLTELSRYVAGGGSTNGMFDGSIPSLPSGHPFTGIQQNYWSSTAVAESEPDAWHVFTESGLIFDGAKTTSHSIWPCRGP